MALGPGTRLGVYEIIALLGSGGMGEVYRARDLKLQRDVAIKVLPQALSDDPERLVRFEREAKTLAALSHANIAHIYGFEDSSGTPALVMELVEGPTLADRVARGPLPLEEALPIAKQIAEGLEAAHEHRVIHRDLKPANIKLRDDGTVKILDFGLAKALETKQPSSVNITQSPTITTPAMMTGVGVILGTAAYMSPEQAKGRPADRRSDIWAFGCVLYEMLTGRRAFDGEDVTDLIAAIVRGDPDWSALPGDVPEHVRLLLRKCLEKDRSQRISDISTAKFLITEPVASPQRPVALSSAAVPAVARPTWRRATPFAITAALASAIAGAAVWFAKPTSIPAPVARFSVTLGEGQTFSPSRHVLDISPDGRQLAFVASQRLYVRPIESVDAKPITDAPPSNSPLAATGIYTPVFSPDGRALAFYSAADRALKRIAVTGGAAVTICPADNPFGMSWDESGIVVAQGSKGIFRVSPNGGLPEELVTLNDGEFAARPQMLPGGTALLFTVANGVALDRWEHARIVVQSLKSGDRKVVIDGGSDGRYVETGHLIFARSGVLYAAPFEPSQGKVTGGPIPAVEGVRRGTMTIAAVAAQNSAVITGAAQFSISKTGSLTYIPGPVSLSSEAYDLALVDRAGAVERLNLPPGNYVHARVSPDGTRVVFGTEDGADANAYVYALGSGTSIQRVTFGGHNRFPIWTADGKRIAFSSDREGDAGIFWQPADGSGTAERLTKAEEGTSHVPESWSPTGDRFLYTVTKGSSVTLWVFSLHDKRSARFDEVASSSPIGSVFSPDGRWVAYAADNTVSVQPFPPTGARYQLPRVPGAHHPIWSPDGKELFYEPTFNQLYVVPVQTQPAFAFGTPVALPAGAFGSTNPAFARNRDIERSGKRFITPISTSQSERGAAPPEIRVVLNWLTELQQRVPTR